MNRKQKIEFICKEVFPKCDINSTLIWCIDPIELLREIDKFRINNHMKVSEKMEAEVKNGYLFINGKPVTRVTVMDGHGRGTYMWTEEGDYWEGRILARQESYFD